MSDRPDGDAALQERDFGTFYRREFAGAVRLAYLLTGDGSAAEDMAQEAFVRVFGRLRLVRNPDALHAYLRRTVVNVAFSRARSAARESRRIATSAVGPPHDELVGERGLDGHVWSAVQRLPDRQKAAVVLRYWLDLSEADAAAALRCRPGTVKSLASRALASLRKELSDDGRCSSERH